MSYRKVACFCVRFIGTVVIVLCLVGFINFGSFGFVIVGRSGYCCCGLYFCCECVNIIVLWLALLCWKKGLHSFLFVLQCFAPFSIFADVELVYVLLRCSKVNLFEFILCLREHTQKFGAGISQLGIRFLNGVFLQCALVLSSVKWWPTWASQISARRLADLKLSHVFTEFSLVIFPMMKIQHIYTHVYAFQHPCFALAIKWHKKINVPQKQHCSQSYFIPWNNLHMHVLCTQCSQVGKR